MEVGLGGSYVISLVRNWSSNSTAELAYKVNAYTVVQPNSVHMLWLLPQFFVMTVAEVMFSVTGLEFSYSQVNFNIFKDNSSTNYLNFPLYRLQKV